MTPDSIHFSLVFFSRSLEAVSLDLRDALADLQELQRSLTDARKPVKADDNAKLAESSAQFFKGLSTVHLVCNTGPQFCDTSCKLGGPAFSSHLCISASIPFHLVKSINVSSCFATGRYDMNYVADAKRTLLTTSASAFPGCCYS